jgi:uncharacterized protein (TIGR00369 family)
MTQQAAPGSSEEPMLSAIREINATAAFNRWAGFEVVCASAGAAELRMSWREEAGQYSGFLHAGVIGALIDTACGYAAATIAGRVLASHYAVNCLAPAVGQSFIARAKVVKAGKRQVFASAELFAEDGTTSAPKLVATGDAILVPIQSRT